MSRDNFATTMPAETVEEKCNKLIAWNGLQLFIPKTWDARVSGRHHLVFESDFRPLFQIRWERSAHRPSHTLQKRMRRYAAELGSVVTAESVPVELQPLADNFDQASCFQTASGMIQGGFCICTECQTLVLFQTLATDPALVKQVSVCLCTLACHHHAKNFWRIQDFTLCLPLAYTLQDYTFGAGLTRLSFSSSDLSLQTCTLGPADMRLKLQPLAEILTTLTNAHQLQVVPGENNTSCVGVRCPTIAQQIFFRLRREKPFVRAVIRHDIDANRLLAVVLSANHPIASTALDDIFQQYEIIQK